MQSDFHIALLGGFEIHHGDDLILRESFERRIGAELVQLLALSPSRRLHREQVLDAFWPDAPMRSSANRLHKAATYARKALGVTSGVVLRGDMVELLPDADVTVDVEIVAKASLDDRDEVARAIELCRGELLPELPYEDWVAGPREAHRRRHGALLEQAGRWRELVELDPTNEGAYLRLMAEMVQVGDRAKALAVYDELEAALDEHSGAPPSPAAEALRDEAEQMSAVLFSTTVLGGNRLRTPEVDIIGREADLVEVGSTILTTRLVTLVGAGGSGKTHLARHVASRVGDHFDDGVWVCEFGTIDDASGVEQQLLGAIGSQRHGDTTVLESITRSLSTRSALIIFDNCEHLCETIASVASRVLDDCPAIRILATSRVPLGVGGELVRPTSELARAAATELFCVRAAEHGVELDASDPAIRGICRQLDDLPLALELAASRTRSLSVSEIESLLDKRFDYLRSTTVPTLDHHQTLSAAIAWSIDALDAELRQTIADLSVFANRFGLDAARAITDRDDATEHLVADHLDELVRRSLLQRVASQDGSSEFRLLESVRLFARALPGGADASDRHLDYILHRFERLENDHSDDPAGVLEAFHREWDDIRTAFGHATAVGRRDDAVRLVACCGMFSLLTIRFELLDWAESVFPDSRVPTSIVEARAIAGWGALLCFRSEYIEGHEMAVLAHEAAPDDELALTALGWSCAAAGEIDRAEELLRTINASDPSRQSLLGANALVQLTIFKVMRGEDVTACVDDLQLYTSTGDSVYRMAWLFSLGCSQMRSQPEVALASLDESLGLADSMGIDLSSMANRSLRSIGAAFIGSTFDALSSIRQALSWAAERGMWSSTLNDFTTAAIVLQRAGRPDVAITLLSAREHSGFARGFGTGRMNLIEELREAHGDVYADCWNRGTNLDAKTAANFALMTIDNLLAASPPD